MPESYEQRIASIANKASIIAKRYNAIKSQRDDAVSEINRLKKEIESYRRNIDKLTTEVEHLKIASNIEHTAGDIEKTRAFLSELVWEINKCINQLSEV